MIKNQSLFIKNSAKFTFGRKIEISRNLNIQIFVKKLCGQILGQKAQFWVEILECCLIELNVIKIINMNYEPTNDCLNSNFRRKNEEKFRDFRVEEIKKKLKNIITSCL